MKIKNILALVCFLCIGVSCSMEDDILNDVDTKGSDTNIADTEAVFSISLSGNGPMTKADEKETLTLKPLRKLRSQLLCGYY